MLQQSKKKKRNIDMKRISLYSLVAIMGLMLSSCCSSVCANSCTSTCSKVSCCKNKDAKSCDVSCSKACCENKDQKEG